MKLDLLKKFVKTIDKRGQAFLYLKSVFPKISQDKLKQVTFVEPPIRHLIKNENFDLKLNLKELVAWRSLKALVQVDLDNHQTTIAESLVTDF